jgi:predicted DNA-binding ribbon-helix-helix protein
LSNLIAEIDSGREHSNLSSAIRLFVLDFYRNQFSRFETSASDTEYNNGQDRLVQ